MGYVFKQLLRGEMPCTVAAYVRETRDAFRKMLEAYVPLIGYSAPERPRIVDVGCGTCYEARVLSDFFGAVIVGIDEIEEDIKLSQALYRIEGETRHTFIHGDARNLRQLVEGEFDVVVSRHPNVAQFPDVWQAIFEETYGVLRSEGLLLATSYRDAEHALLEEVVQRAGYRIVLSTANEYPIRTPRKETSVDRKVLFARKL